MAESAAERTEQPTARRLSKASEKGQVPYSQDMVSAVSLIALLAATFMMGPKIVEWATTEIREGLSCDYSLLGTSQACASYFSAKLVGAALIMAPFLLTLLVFTTGTNILISGLQWAPAALAWKLDGLDPVKGLKRLISPAAAVKLLLSVLKLILISTIVYFYLRGKLTYLATFQWAWTSQLLAVISKLITGVVIRLCLGLLVIGVIDMIYQKYKFTQSLKMTKQEVKDEMRDAETAPEVQRRIRQRQYELATRRMLHDVPKASVVIVNPTHVAVALRYDPDTMQAPVVVAKGGDHVCEKIKEVARAYGVPIIRRPEIARSLYASADIGKAIPDSLFVAVAEILALVYRLRQRR
ncbi:MAG: flagellar biosynthesis protein FlhB [Phycisphaerae bacterium]|nr:flagellar biosynthesis protein FlhB [Phycisphaerae bacterium]